MPTDTCVIHVNLARGEAFNVQKALACQYTIEILSGQHVNTCDFHLLATVFQQTKVEEIPNIVWKQVEVYANLTSDEKSLLVIASNEKRYLAHSQLDKVCLLD